MRGCRIAAMDRFLPLFLTRAAAIVVAGMLLFAVFGQATHHGHAVRGDYRVSVH